MYYGFPILDDLEVDGFRLGIITDFEASPESGDAFIVAPDDSRAGLVWETSENEEFGLTLEPDEERWGVYWVTLRETMETPNGRLRNLQHLVALLRPKWEAWRSETR